MFVAWRSSVRARCCVRHLSSEGGADGYFRLTDRSFLRVQGASAAKFLHDLCSNDMSIYDPKIPPPVQRRMMRLSERADAGSRRHWLDAQYAGFFNPKGRLLYDAFVIPLPSAEQRQELAASGAVAASVQDFLVECSAAAAERFLAHLRKYRLREKLAIDDVSSDYCAHAVVQGGGPVAAATASFADPRLAALGHRYVLPAGSPPLCLAELPLELYHSLRCAHGVPEGPVDLQPEQALPLEAGLDLLHGVSFEKGCYLGQELTSRVHHTGMVRKRYYPVLAVADDCDPSTLSRCLDTVAELQAQLAAGVALPPLLSALPADAAFLPLPGPQQQVFVPDAQQLSAVGALLGCVGKLALAHLRVEHVVAKKPLLCVDQQQRRLRLLPVVPPLLAAHTVADADA